MFSVKATKSVLIKTLGRNNKLNGIKEMYLKLVTISESFNKKPISKISMTKSSCVTTFDRLAKTPYFQNSSVILIGLLVKFKSDLNFLIKTNKVKIGASNRATAYPFA